MPAAVLGTAGLRFAVTGAYQLSAASAWQHIAGLVGLLLFVLGVYAALAMALEDARHATVLPVGRRRPLEAGRNDQSRRIEAEAGVREQL